MRFSVWRPASPMRTASASRRRPARSSEASSPGSQATSNTRPPISRMSSGMSDLLDERLELGDQVVERRHVLVALDAQPVELVGELGLLALERARCAP